MKRFGLFLVLVAALVQAQETADVGPGFFDNIRARQLGPTTMGGRITDLAVYEKEPRIFYVGSASGGLWKTVNGGVTMTCVFEKENTISIGACAVSQKDPDLVWVGTGEATSRNSVAWGDGVYKSTDGGKSWQHMGLTATRHISRVVIDPSNPDVVYVAALGELWGYNEDRGVFKTTDGGKTWQKVLYVDEKTGIADLKMDPKNPKVLVAAAWQKLRKAYDFTSGGPGSALYKTTDGGKTWRKITKGLPTTTLGRIGLGYYRKNPKVMMATIEYAPPPAQEGGGTQTRPRGNGTFRSEDGGESWKQVNPINPRPFYFSVVEIDPTDDQRAYVLGVDLAVTTNRGERFNTLNLRVHSDWHALWINPADPYHMIAGTDGGVYQTRDRGDRWEHIDILPLGQFYCATYDMRKPYWVYGGLQDNLCWAFPTQTVRGGAIASDAYTVNASGDGFHVAVDPNDWTTVYAEAQGGALTRMDQRNGTSRGIKPGASNTTPPRAQGETWRFNWSSPILISPHNSRTIYFGGNKLFKSINRGDNWRVVSPDLTTNDPTKFRPGRQSVTPEDTGAERHCTIITITESPKRQGLLYVGTDDGQVQVSMDDGGSWTNVTRNIPDLPLNTWCSRVVASKWEEGRVYATFDGHRNNDYKAYAYVSEDYGKTWTRISEGLPDYDCLYVIREGEQNPDLLYLGSEMSLRFSLDRGKTWVKYRGMGFPTVAIHDVQVHPRDLDLIIGTHGRSIWTLPVAALEQLTPDALAADVFLCRPQNVWLMGRSTSGGAGWNGDRGFSSPNTQPGTTIFYRLKKDAKDQVRIVISDILGQEVASLRGPGSAGLQAVAWNVRGRRLAAGDYRVTLTVDGKDYISAVKVEDLVAMGDIKEGIGLPMGEQGADDGSVSFQVPWQLSR